MNEVDDTIHRFQTQGVRIVSPHRSYELTGDSASQTFTVTLDEAWNSTTYDPTYNAGNTFRFYEGTTHNRLTYVDGEWYRPIDSYLPAYTDNTPDTEEVPNFLKLIKKH